VWDVVVRVSVQWHNTLKSMHPWEIQDREDYPHPYPFVKNLKKERMRLPNEGSRIALAGFFGTVKFVGQVEGSSGIWLGVDWDDPLRGKHSGSKDGKIYFHCR
jgi:hypothetical protein